MEEFYKKNDRFAERLELLFKILFLINGFLLASSLTYGKRIISFVIWPLAALGGLLVLYRFLNFKHFLHSRGLAFLIFFTCSYVASSVYTLRYGFYENLRYTIFFVFQFGLLYAYDSDRDPSRTKRQFLCCAKFYTAVMALLSVLSFIFMIAGYNKTFEPKPGEDIPVYYIGFVIGRLFGAYWDPNIAATMASVAILLSVYFCRQAQKPWLRVLHILNILLQVAYITFSDSRTGRLALLAGLILLAALLGAKHKFSQKKAVQAVCVLLVVVLTAGVAYMTPKAVKDSYNAALAAAVERRVENPATEEPGEETDSSDLSDHLLERGYDLSTDPSNRRFDIWKGAVEIFKTSPVLGVSRANILPYVDENLPDSYLVNNSYMRIKSMHNMFFEILASQGVLGVLAFVAFVISMLVGIFKNWRFLWTNQDFALFAVVICILGAICASSLVITEIVYVSSPMSTIFWLGLGYLNHALTKGQEVRSV